MEALDYEIEDRMIRMNLLSARKSAHISQQELAGRSGLALSTISAIESNFDRSPTLESIIRYADAVGYTFTTIKSPVGHIIKPIKIEEVMNNECD